jgi:uncharacterized protein DUF1571
VAWKNKGVACRDAKPTGRALPPVQLGEQGGWFMRRLRLGRNLRAWLVSSSSALVVTLGLGIVGAQSQAQEPGNQVASVPTTGQPPAAAEHPLMPAYRMALAVKANIDQNVKDYTCTMIKRERVDGKLSDPAYMFCKVRNQPFSAYLYFLKPADAYGREVIYSAGANNGNLLAHEGQGLKAKFGMVSLNPTSAMAMDGNRYPITELGIANLTNRLIQVAQQDMKYGECEVQFRKNAKVNDRVCTIIDVTHPVPRRNFLFYKAVIYLDDQLNVPIRYEAYSWPKTPGGPAVLDEEYTYLNLKLNVGLTNADFDPHNPSYHFVR